MTDDPDDLFKPLSAKVLPKRFAKTLAGSGRALTDKQIAAAARRAGHNSKKVKTKFPKGGKPNA